MWKAFYFLLFCLSSFSLSAATYKTKVHSLEPGPGKEAALVYLEDGHVAFIEKTTKTSQTLLKAVEESLRRSEWVEVRLDKNLNLQGIQSIPVDAPEDGDRADQTMRSRDLLYDPSILSSSEASTAFRGMRRDYQNDSQCYNRAHIWTYEEFIESALKSNKLFLFFTSKYIRAYRYHWWFHVTPMVFVGTSNQEGWRTLDRRYTSGPLTTKTWTNIFMHNNAACKVVNKYYDYRNNQQAQWCYLIPTSMYFWQPRDIERRDRTGYEKSNYIQSEINHAYWEAF